MITARRTEVTIDDACVCIRFTYRTPYEATVFFDHITDCLDTGRAFAIEIDVHDKPNRKQTNKPR